MGLEWHNRKRSQDGRFARQARKMAFHTGEKFSQIHIRVPAELAERVRRLAIKCEMEISEFCCLALMEACRTFEDAEQSSGQAAE